MPLRAQGPRRQKASSAPAAMPSVMALPPRLWSARTSLLKIMQTLKQPLLLTMTRNLPSSANWCCGFQACCGDCGATSMETGLFEAQARDLITFGAASRPSADPRQINFASIEELAVEPNNDAAELTATTEPEHTGLPSATTHSAVTLARCFLTLPNFAIDRLNRYEVALWRQVVQTLFALDALDRRKPQERTPRHPASNRLHIYRRDQR